MVYNPVYNFLFIHIQKNAGTSITNALLSLPSSQFIFPAHLRLEDLKFKNKTKPFIFAVVRNPWDRLVSWYEMMNRKSIHNDFSRYLLTPKGNSGSLVDFSEFIRRTNIIEETNLVELGSAVKPFSSDSFEVRGKYYKSLGFNQADYLSDENGQFICDMTLRFENINSDWEALIARLNLPIDAKLKSENANPLAVDWESFYSNSKDKEWVGDLYSRDIELFGYKN